MGHYLNISWNLWLIFLAHLLLNILIWYLAYVLGSSKAFSRIFFRDLEMTLGWPWTPISKGFGPVQNLFSALESRHNLQKNEPKMKSVAQILRSGEPFKDLTPKVDQYTIEYRGLIIFFWINIKIFHIMVKGTLIQCQTWKI